MPLNRSIRDQSYAVQLLYVFPADFVLRDREGVEVDEQVFLATVEANLVRGQQWWWDVFDVYGTGGCFSLAPTLIFRSARTEAQIRTETPNYAYALRQGMWDADAAGLIDFKASNRYFQLAMPLNWMEYGGNAVGGENMGNPHMLPGYVVSAGDNTLLPGGLKKKYLSEPTNVVVVPSPTNTGPTLTVTSGHGRRFSVAARADDNQRVAGFSNGSATTAATLLLDSNWVPAAVPFDAVIFPAQTTPTPSNAECVLVTAISGNNWTVVRGRYGTTPRVITAGDRASLRETTARIWPADGQPEDPGSESVQVTSISGDTLTITRAQADAMNLAAQTSGRVVLAGDRVACVDRVGLNFAQNENQMIGGFVHELGHGIGGKFWTPRETASFSVVTSPGGVVTVVQVNATVDYRGAATPPGGQTIGYYQHLPHTPDNPLTPGLYKDIGQSLNSAMFAWWDFPSLAFTADERARIEASPFHVVQDRPPVWTADGKSPLGGPYAAFGGGGGSDPEPGTYYVQPLAWWASDTATDTVIWNTGEGVSAPFSLITFANNIDQNVLAVRRWFWDHFDGYTFDALPVVGYVSEDTKTQVAVDLPGINHFRQGLREADLALPGIDVTDPHRLHYMITPLANIAATYSAALGRTEIFSAFPYGSSSDLPAQCVQWAGPTNVGRNFGAFIDFGASGGPFQADANLACGVFAHELGHVFGYSASWPNADHLYPHDESAPPGGGQNLMAAGMTFMANLKPSADAVARFKTSPFMSHHSSRP